jgi:ABC-type methionine transport system permease subunit
MKLGILIGIVAAVLVLTVGAIVVSANIVEETTEAEKDTSCGCGVETCTGQCGGGCGTGFCGCQK